jgi:hypothetical protein
MKKIISIMAASILLLAINTAKAQTIADYRKMTAEQKTQLVSDSLKFDLNLNADQYKQVQVVVADAIHQIAPILQGTGDRTDKGRKVRTILGDSEIKLKAILTPEQSMIFESKKTKLMAYYRQKIANQPMLFNAPAK